MLNINNISLEGRYDNHIHCCPHINARSLNLFEAIEDAEKEKMKAIGLMDNFSNTSGYASLLKKNYKNYKLDIFGGLIMEPYTGGVNSSIVEILTNYAYEDSTKRFKFISFPTHHTQYIAKQEKRSKVYIDSCFSLTNIKKVDNNILKILEIISKKNLVLNTGHISGEEIINLISLAKNFQIKKILIPSNHLSASDIKELKKITNVFFEFSYFFISKATTIPLTHIDGEKHIVEGINKNILKNLINEAQCKNVILSSDCGVSVLPKPTIGFKNFISEILSLGFNNAELDLMTKDNPRKLFYE